MSTTPESTARSVLVVVAIAAVCAAGLAFVKQSTAHRIAEAKRQETLAALQRVVPQGCSVALEQLQEWPPGGKEAMTVYPGFDDEAALCGVAVRVRTDKGYSGKLVLLAGFSGLESDGGLVLNRIFVIEHAETPGLGSLITKLQDEPPESWGEKRTKVFGLNFLNRALREGPLEVKKTDAGPHDVVAITAATISSRAVTGAVQRASELVKTHRQAMVEAFAGGK